MKCHAYVLEIAGTDEKRQLILLLHALRVFFRKGSASVMQDGLAAARMCNHEDAHFLVSLFPEGAPATTEEARAIFLAQGEDRRCLCWAIESGGLAWREPWKSMVMRSEEAGYSRAQHIVGVLSSDDNQVTKWLEKACAQHETQAMVFLGQHLFFRNEKARAEELWRQAAELGDPSAQYDLADKCCEENSLERFEWLRRSAANSVGIGALERLVYLAVEQTRRWDRGSSGRNVFEIGAALCEASDWKKTAREKERQEAGERAIELYEQWLEQARRAVLCWMRLSKQLRMPKDIRLLIAHLMWRDRSVWSERPEKESDESGRQCSVS